MNNNNDFEVIIIGGSYAGLSAAMALGRSLRHVLIVDGGLPCNRQTPYSHNFVTHDGEAPAEIAKRAKENVLKYKTVSFLDDIAIMGQKVNDGFIFTTQSGRELKVKKVIFATGVKDVMPEIKGFSDCWGISVIHCPYCHGYEFKGKKTAILANGERAFHLASMVNNLTDKLIVFTNGKADFTEAQAMKFKQRNIIMIETPIAAIDHKDGLIRQIIAADGTSWPLDALYSSLPFTQHSEIPRSLGCEITENGHIKVNLIQETNIEGIFACGDNSNLMRSLALAVSTGNVAGTVVNGKLIQESF